MKQFLSKIVVLMIVFSFISLSGFAQTGQSTSDPVKTEKSKITKTTKVRSKSVKNKGCCMKSGEKCTDMSKCKDKCTKDGKMKSTKNMKTEEPSVK